MGDGNFASLTDYLRVRKGEAEPSPVMPSQALPFVPAPVNAPTHARPTRQSTQRELPALSAVADVSAKPRRMILQLSATEYEALGMVAAKESTTPQDLVRKVLRNFFVEFVEQCGGSRY